MSDMPLEVCKASGTEGVNTKAFPDLGSITVSIVLAILATPAIQIVPSSTAVAIPAAPAKLASSVSPTGSYGS